MLRGRGRPRPGVSGAPALPAPGRETGTVAMLADLGLALLMFMAGYEVDFARIRGRPLRRAALAWLCSVALGLGAGWALLRRSRIAAGEAER
ncbi:hypothetical protein ABZ512_27390 [Nocardiopsis dassonvillei]|uniref:hypothetical protein n=1 Tax=Nocardiopsis dassonvillei TaxID=2014 RepID=UPI0033EDCCB2